MRELRRAAADVRARARGAYDAPAEPVEPGTPAALPPFPSGLPPNRLGLARWLTSTRAPADGARGGEPPLGSSSSARGLVETPEDFGMQGAAPTHPELLDWLAAQFVDGGLGREGAAAS